MYLEQPPEPLQPMPDWAKTPEGIARIKLKHPDFNPDDPVQWWKARECRVWPRTGFGEFRRDYKGDVVWFDDSVYGGCLDAIDSRDLLEWTGVPHWPKPGINGMPNNYPYCARVDLIMLRQRIPDVPLKQLEEEIIKRKLPVHYTAWSGDHPFKPELKWPIAAWRAFLLRPAFLELEADFVVTPGQIALKKHNEKQQAEAEARRAAKEQEKAEAREKRQAEAEARKAAKREEGFARQQAYFATLREAAAELRAAKRENGFARQQEYFAKLRAESAARKAELEKEKLARKAEREKEKLALELATLKAKLEALGGQP